MIDYPLHNGLVRAGALVEVGQGTGHFWFPSLHRVGGDTLVCACIRSADVAQGKWPADLFVSHDAGGSWHPDQRIDSYGHTSVRDSSSTLMMPYEQWPQSPGDRQNCVAPGNVLTMADGALVVESRDVRVVDFPRPLADYHEDELRLQHNGNILCLKDGSLLTTMYGKFDGEEGYNTFAVVSDDGGFSWTYRSTVAGSDAASSAPEGPNESNTLRLDNGDLLCVYRVGGGWDFHKSISADEGRTWSPSVRMEGKASVQPRLAWLGNGAIVLTGGRPGLFLWLCADGQGDQWERVNLGEHHNRLVEPDADFSEAFCNAQAGEDPAMSTSYTALMPWGADGLIVTYDRLANGWAGAPGPNGAVDRVFSLAVTVSI